MVYDVYNVHPAAPVPAVTNAQRKHVLDEADSLWKRDRHTHVNRVVDHALAAAERAGDSPGRFVSPNAAGLTQRNSTRPLVVHTAVQWRSHSSRRSPRTC